MARNHAPFVREWDTVGDRPGELNLPNPTRVASCSWFGLDETHKIPNRCRTVFPTCYEPLFPRLDLRTAITRTATPTTEADEAAAIPNPPLLL